MSQILSRNKKLDIDLLFTVEKKLCIHQHHKVNILTYKKNIKVPKGLLLKFNLALCTDNNVLREQCNNILFNAPAQIRNKIIKALGQEINSLKKERKSLLNNNKASTNHQEIETIKRNIYNIKYSIKRKTVQKQNRKHRRDNISNKDNIGKRKKNRRFNRDLLTQKRKIKNKRRKENYLKKISEIKANAADQNAINLSTTTLTEAKKSLLMKSPSFVPTPSDVNWYEMRKDFEKFVNQLRFKARSIIEPNANTTNDVTTNTGINAARKPEPNIAPL